MRSASVDRKRSDKNDLLALHCRLGAVVKSLVEFVSYTEAALLGRSLPQGRQEQLLGDLEAEAGRWQQTLLYAFGVNEALLRKHRALPALSASSASFQTLSSLIAETQNRVTEALLGRTDVKVNAQVWEAFTWLNQHVFETLQSAGTLERENATLRNRISQLEQQLQDTQGGLALLKTDSVKHKSPASLAEELEVTFLKHKESPQSEDARRSYPGLSDTNQHLQRQQEEITRFLSLIKSLETEKSAAEVQAQQHLEARLKAEREAKLGKAVENEQLLSQLRHTLEEKLALSKIINQTRLDLTKLLSQPLLCESSLLQVQDLLHTNSQRLLVLQQNLTNLQTRYQRIRAAHKHSQTKDKDVTRLKQALLKLKDELESSRKQASERLEGLQRSIDRLREDREALKHELSSTGLELKDTHTELVTVQQERDQLKSQLSGLVQTQADWQRRVNSVNAEREKMQAEVSGTQTELARLRQELEARGSSSQQMNSLELRLNQLSAAQQEKDTRLAHQAAEIRKLRTELGQAQSRVRQLEAELLRWTGTSAALETKVKQLETDKVALATQVQERQNELQQVQTNLTVSETQRHKLAADLQKLLTNQTKAQQGQAELFQCRQTIQTLETALQEAREELTAYQTQAEATLQQYRADLTSTQTKVNQLEIELSNSLVKTKRLESDLLRIQSDFAISQTKVREAEAQVQVLMVAEVQLKGDLQRANSLKTELQTRLTAAETAVKKGEEKLATREAQHQQLQRELKAAQTRSREEDLEAIQRKNDELASIEAANQELETTLQRVKKENSAVKERETSLQKQLQKLISEQQSAATHLEQKETHFVSVRQELQSKEQAVIERDAEIQQLKTELAHKRNELYSVRVEKDKDAAKLQTQVEESNSLRKQLEQAADTLTTLHRTQEELQTLKQQLLNHSSELHTCKAQAAEAERKQCEAEETCATLTSQLQAETVSRTALKAQLSHAKQEAALALRQAQNEAEALRNQLKDTSTAQTTGFLTQIQDLQSAVDAASRRAEELSQQKEELEERLKARTEEISRLNAQKQEMTGSLQKQTEQIRVLTTQSDDLRENLEQQTTQVHTLTLQKQELAETLRQRSEHLQTISQEHLILQEKLNAALAAEGQTAELNSEVMRLQNQLQASEREAETLRSRRPTQDNLRFEALQREVETLEAEQEELVTQLRTLAHAQHRKPEDCSRDTLLQLCQQAVLSAESQFHRVQDKLTDLDRNTTQVWNKCLRLMQGNQQLHGYKHLLQEADLRTRQLQRALEDKPKGINPFTIADVIEMVGAETEASLRLALVRLDEQEERLETLTQRVQQGKPAAVRQVGDFVLAVLGQLQQGASAHLEATESRLDQLEDTVMRLSTWKREPLKPVQAKDEVTVLAEGSGQSELGTLVDTVARLYSENEEQAHVIEALTQENVLLKDNAKRGAVQNSERVAETALSLLEVLPEQ